MIMMLVKWRCSANVSKRKKMKMEGGCSKMCQLEEEDDEKEEKEV